MEGYTGTPVEESNLAQRKANIEDYIEAYRQVVGGYELKEEPEENSEFDSPILDPANWEEKQPTGYYNLVVETLEGVWAIFDGKPNYNNPDYVPIMTQFFSLLSTKRDFWYNMKNDFGAHIFTEGYYEDEIETDSKILYYQAKRAHEEHNKPLEEYQVTYINLSDIIGVEMLEPRVGDYI